MEVRTIKTCFGLQEIRFLDGALLPKDARIVEVCEARKLQAETELWRELDKIVKETYLADLPLRQVPPSWSTRQRPTA